MRLMVWGLLALLGGCSDPEDAQPSDLGAARDAMIALDASADMPAPTLDAMPQDGDAAIVDAALALDLGEDPVADMTAGDATIVDMAADMATAPDAASPPACEGEDPWPAVDIARDGRYARFIAPAEGIPARRVTVFLPAGYDAQAAPRYPVFYMHDGQNLFDPREAAFGQVWAVDAAIDGLGDAIEPIIVVGVDNAGADRLFEYTPSVDADRGDGGGAAAYGAFLVEQLKPFIDARFRTACHDTGVGGSSLGGLLSLHLWLEYPEVFQRVAAVSPSFWWDGRAILDRLDVAWPAGARVWIDGGGAEGSDPDGDGRSSVIEDSRAVAEALHAAGAPFPAGLGYYEDVLGEHNEPTWRARLPALLTWLYGPPLPAPTGLTVRAWTDAPFAGVPQPMSVDARWQVGSGLTLTLPYGLAAWMGGHVVDGMLTPGPAPARVTATWQGQRGEYDLNPGAAAQVEFRVRVPAQPVAEAVFLAGDAPSLGAWDPAGVALRREGGVWTATVPLPAGEPFAFKVTRGSWDTVEKGPNGEEIADRGGLAVDGVFEVDVARWADSPR